MVPGHDGCKDVQRPTVQGLETICSGVSVFTAGSGNHVGYVFTEARMLKNTETL